jgi:hypothetical protein
MVLAVVDNEVVIFSFLAVILIVIIVPVSVVRVSIMVADYVMMVSVLTVASIIMRAFVDRITRSLVDLIATTVIVDFPINVTLGATIVAIYVVVASLVAFEDITMPAESAVV